MKEFLRKINLVTDLTTELNIRKSDFTRSFREHVDEKSTGFMSGLSDIFSSHKKIFKGYIGNNEFKISRTKRLFDMNNVPAIAKGRYLQKGKVLIIETEINGFSKALIPFYVFAIFLCSIVIITFLFGNRTAGNMMWIVLPFTLLHGIFMFSVPYLIMRRSTKKMAYDLEREFFYMTKNYLKQEYYLVSKNSC